jgi:hypothetical protein
MNKIYTYKFEEPKRKEVDGKESCWVDVYYVEASNIRDAYKAVPKRAVLTEVEDGKGNILTTYKRTKIKFQET